MPMMISLFNPFKRSRSQNFPGLRWRLLIIYLVAMAAIYGTSAVALYVFFSRSLHKQLNEQLLTLVEAAAPSLDVIKTRGRQSLDNNRPWHHLFSRQQQSLEWFDARGNLIAQEGADFPQFSLGRGSPASFWDNAPFSNQTSNEAPVFQQQGQLRTVMIRVYAYSDENKLQLEGYIRASESTQKIAAVLNQLRWELELGGIIVWVLISLSGIYLTKQALVPTVDSLQQLEQFTTQVSHNLRTPLTRVSLAVELMLSDSESIEPSQSRKLEIITRAVAKIKRLIDDLLLLTRIEAASTASNSDQTELGGEGELPGNDRLAESNQRRLGLTLVPAIHLDEILADLLASVQEIAQEKEIELQANWVSHPAIKGNATLLNRLFFKLLENAIAYTEPGGTVRVTLERTRQYAVVSIADTGIGIAPESLPMVFERFWHSEQAQTLNQEGLGLGLAVAQAIAEQHKGKIMVSSEVGRGSCFQVYLPLAA